MVGGDLTNSEGMWLRLSDDRQLKGRVDSALLLRTEEVSLMLPMIKKALGQLLDIEQGLGLER